MNQDTNSKAFSLVIFLLVLFVVVKLAWVAIEYFYLPKDGISVNRPTIAKSLYYRYGLATDTELPKPDTGKKAEKLPTMSNMVLRAIYSEQYRSVVVIQKGAKSYILATGDDIDGFVLEDATATEAYFKKNGKNYTLKLQEKRGKSGSSVNDLVSTPPTSDLKEKKKSDISVNGDTREIPKNIIKKYTSDFKSIVKDIGLKPVRQDGQIYGYEVRFIRHGSPMGKLGLKKGDIIKSINGEDIIDPSTPMSFLKKANSLENLTITILRQNQEKDLEYEVK